MHLRCSFINLAKFISVPDASRLKLKQLIVVSSKYTKTRALLIQTARKQMQVVLLFIFNSHRLMSIQF